MEKYFFISEYFLPLLIIKYNFMKTFTITKEQIEELSKWKHGKRLMQEWFPEAFEKQLEVGKVYKNKYSIFKVTDLKDDVYSGYGLENEKWLSGDFSKKFTSNDVEATKEEWLEALKEEAKRRGFKKGVKYNYVNNPYLIKRFKDKLYLGHSVDLVDGGDIILEDGVWAEVIKEEKPTQEEIDRVLDYLKKQK